MTTSSKLVTLPATRMVALALGAAALGAFAVGALAIGAVAIGSVAIRKAKFGSVEIDELTVRQLRVLETARVAAGQAMTTKTSAGFVRPVRGPGFNGKIEPAPSFQRAACASRRQRSAPGRASGHSPRPRSSWH